MTRTLIAAGNRGGNNRGGIDDDGGRDINASHWSQAGGLALAGGAADLHELSLDVLFRYAFDGAGFPARDFLLDQHLLVADVLALATVIAMTAVTAPWKLGQAVRDFLHLVDRLLD